jgi:hypothetical protein
VILLTGKNLYAQEKKSVLHEDIGPISTDRPDQTDGTTIMPSGFLQYETGSFYSSEDNDLSRQELLIYTNNLIRYGINNHLELRLSGDILKISKTEKSENIRNRITGTGPIALGTKFHLCEEKKARPALSMSAIVKLPFLAVSELRPTFPAPTVKLLAAHNLTENISLSYNVGADWLGKSAVPVGLYSVSLGIGLFKGMTLFTESFGLISKDSKPQYYTDAGFTYLLGKNFQIDISGGTGLSGNTLDYLISGGFAFRINTK